MMEGLLHHGTEVPIQANYVDTHGASEVGFAFTHLLGGAGSPGAPTGAEFAR